MFFSTYGQAWTAAIRCCLRTRRAMAVYSPRPGSYAFTNEARFRHMTGLQAIEFVQPGQWQ